MYPDKYVRMASDVPETEHYTIIESATVYIPGDQRSEECPGHGYPASSHPYINYEAYFTKEKLLAAVKQLCDRDSNKLKSIKIVKVTPVTFTVNVDIK